MPDKTIQLLKAARAHLEAIETGRAKLKPHDSKKLAEIKDNLFMALRDLSEVYPIPCNGQSCPPNMECKNGTCKPLPP